MSGLTVFVKSSAFIFLDAILTHLPERSSLVNGYGSPSSSWNGREHSVHLNRQQTGDIRTERSGKKKKKRKKAEVAMIAESSEAEESYFVNKQIEVHKDFDSEGSDKDSKADTNLNGDQGKTDHPSGSALDTEGDTSSEISLTMELPVTETVLQQIITDEYQQPASMVTSESFTSAGITEEGTATVGSIAHDEHVHDEKGIVHFVDCSSSKLSDSALKTDELYSSKIEEGHVSDENVSHQSCETQHNIVEGESSSSTKSPEIECQSSTQTPLEGLVHGEIDRVTEKETLTNDTDTPEYHAALAAFECGTPKQVDSIWQIERERGMSAESNASYEGEDLNIVPGIHRSYDTRSRSGSSGSFNGSGSFQLGSQRSSRHSTMDSMYRTSTFGSAGTPSGSWPGRGSFSSRKSSKTDVTIGSPSSEGQFSEYEMFDELLGLEEDHFSPPEVSLLNVKT